MNKKQRKQLLIPSFKENTNIGGFHEEDGIFSFKDPKGKIIIPTSMFVAETYLKNNGKFKVLSQIPTRNERINLNTFQNNLNYDWLLVIDTNSKEYNGKKISVSCSAFFTISLDEPKKNKGSWEQSLEISFQLLDAFIAINPKINPEILGWLIIIDWVLKAKRFKKSYKVGIIVDSLLDKIPNINRRKETIIENYFLPPNFELIYASSDVGKDNPNNKMITICDRMANKVWEYILKNPEVLNNNLENIDNHMDASTIVDANTVYNIYKTHYL